MKIVSKKGFTLIELLIAISLAGVALALIVTFFARSTTVYTRENARAELQQEMRAALELMSRDIRMAAYDPQNTGEFKIENASATTLKFTTDWNDDGEVVTASGTGEECEMITYRYSNADNSIQHICREGLATSNVQTLVGGSDGGTPLAVQVTDLNFEYRDNSNSVTTFENEIRAVVITMAAEIAAGRAGMQSREYTTWVDLRNAGPNSNKK